MSTKLGASLLTNQFATTAAAFRSKSAGQVSQSSITASPATFTRRADVYNFAVNPH